MQTKPVSTEMNSQQDRADNQKLVKAWLFAFLKKKKKERKEKKKGRIAVLCGFACFVPTAKVNVSHCIYMCMFEGVTEDLIQLSTSFVL